MDLKDTDLLLNDQLAPITSAIGFIELEWTTLISEFVKWQNDIKNKHGIQISTSSISGDLENVLCSLLPLRMVDVNRYLFMPTESKWIAYLDNDYQGTDSAAVHYLARRCQCRTIYIVAKTHTFRPREDQQIGRQGALIFEVYGPEKTDWLNRVREITLANDAGKWIFEESGKPFPFEETDRYQSKRKKDRFTFDLLKHYLEQFGLSPFEEDFYLPSSHPSATLVELSGNLPPTSRDVSFEEARKLNFID